MKLKYFSMEVTHSLSSISLASESGPYAPDAPGGPPQPWNGTALSHIHLGWRLCAASHYGCITLKVKPQNAPSSLLERSIITWKVLFYRSDIITVCFPQHFPVGFSLHIDENRTIDSLPCITLVFVTQGESVKGEPHTWRTNRYTSFSVSYWKDLYWGWRDGSAIRGASSLPISFSLNPSAWVWWNTTACNSSYRHSDALFWPPLTPCIHVAYV